MYGLGWAQLSSTITGEVVRIPNEDNQMADYSYLGWHWVLSDIALLLLHVLLVGHLLLLFGREAILRLHTRASWHGSLLGWNLGVADIFWRIYGLFAFHTILVVLRRFGGIQARLQHVSKRAIFRLLGCLLG